MKLAIMQPYFFPYLGYFSLIEYADLFIVFDTPQYDRKGWMHRNRILKPREKGGWQYVNAGVTKPAFKAAIKDVEVRQDWEWKYRILRQLEHYKKVAPYYSETNKFLAETLASNFKSLVELNRHTLECVCEYIGMTHHVEVFSEMELSIGSIAHPGQWALRISQAVNATEYVNPPGGKEIFDGSEFNDAGITLGFLENTLCPYSQQQKDFLAALSVIDVLMFNSPEQTLELIKQYWVSSPVQFTALQT